MNLKILSASITLITSLLSLILVFLFTNNESNKFEDDTNPSKSFQRYETHTKQGQKKIEGVPAIPQYPELPAGCEATTITMILNWAGIRVNKEDIAKDIPKEPIPDYRNGKYIGGNPDAGFLGDPFSESGYGVFDKPVITILNQYLPGRALNLTGTSFEKILSTVESGAPVMVWITRHLKEPTVSDTWEDSNGKQIKWLSPQHTMLVVGYSQTEVMVNDPQTGATVSYPRDLFEKRWTQMGSHAVSVVPQKTGDSRNTKRGIF
ncbi:C39 family peptidase [Effusibacillus consociatus]|uniref:C39 family peptidase n=1 Tax=Effusibacillus consociatus TaxID=1117041 RepID=A0ABV9Q7J9_9BACL